MATFEVIEAKRPLEAVGWIERAAKAAEEIFGHGTLDFQDGRLAERGVVLLSREEQERMYRRVDTLGHLATDDITDTVERGMPISFEERTEPSLRNKPKIKTPREPNRGGKRLVVARTGYEGRFTKERHALTEAINRGVRMRLPWERFGAELTLATVETDAFISNYDLAELGKHLPSRIHVGRGQLNRVTAEPY
ncbi:MAG TPA: hypothetical protein VFX86_04215 [Candidatus Saccharimonadales bacterium]|nr:hypothetical protein [Candidatus Saccharimonadales bacterium]